jgi:hypothetical protein
VTFINPNGIRLDGKNSHISPVGVNLNVSAAQRACFLESFYAGLKI